jgi:hypothetical protein
MRVAIDMIESLVGGNIRPAGFQCRDQFDFVMIVFGQRRIRMISDLPRWNILDRIRRLLKEERRLTVRI